jgi:ligand-binding SRPBCC domain-containing protein
VLGLGDDVTFRARHLGRTWTMTSRITACDPPRSFVDEQVTGPFAAMRHVHELVEDAGVTTMADQMTLRPPLGRLGEVVGGAVLRAYLRRLLAQRAAVVKRLAEAGS